MTSKKTTKPNATGTFKVELYGSLIGSTEGQRACVRGLGLRRMRHVVERADTVENRGMAKKVPHLVRFV
ncbi:MAG: 50S ribosomal protein L30 [Vicinamibacteria bacterium]|jgi:large subunit ribosomal protein L30|nr:50S ribosomal protein L30 [Vicinamibacteria bacterium]